MKEYEMTDEKLLGILNACKPVPYMVFGGVPPLSPQVIANQAWQDLGTELGFDWETVQPIPGKSAKFFAAEERGKP